MPEYEQPDEVKAKALNAKAELLAKEGSDQGGNADDYVRTTVYLATVLFLIGISSHFPIKAARYGLTVVGVAILLFAIVQLLSFPRPV